MGHDLGRANARLKLAAIALTLVLAGCASVPRSSTSAPPALPAPVQSGAPTTSPTILMIDSARAMLGQPYRWGGDAPGGFDCSGLVVYAAAGAGIRVPRTAREQEDYGWPVTRTDLRAGDLVFMHLTRKELHVGIALDGDRFIHAPSSGGHVRIDSLNAAPYSRGFIGARRFIDSR